MVFQLPKVVPLIENGFLPDSNSLFGSYGKNIGKNDRKRPSTFNRGQFGSV